MAPDIATNRSRQSSERYDGEPCAQAIVQQILHLHRGLLAVNGWQELVSNIIGNSMWPLVVLILGVIFRDTLRSVLERLTGIEGLGAKFEFTENIRRIDSEAEMLRVETTNEAVLAGSDAVTASELAALSGGSELESDGQSPNSAPHQRSREFRTDRSDSATFGRAFTPAARILKAWERGERELRTMFALESAIRRERGEPFQTPTNPHDLTKYLFRWRRLTGAEFNIIFNLRETRDKVTREGVEPTEAQAVAYEGAIRALISSLRLTSKTIARERGESSGEDRGRLRGPYRDR